MIRIMTGNLDYDVRGQEPPKQLGLMNLKEIGDHFMSVLVTALPQCVNGTAPLYLCDVLTVAASIHTRVNSSTTDNIPYMSTVHVICLSNLLSTGRRRSGIPFLVI